MPDKGNIVLLDFDPSAGKEIIKRRPALVLSRRAFNGHAGFSIVAPITNTARGMALEVQLQEGTTSGLVLMYQLRSLEVTTRNVSFVEKATQSVIDRATEIATTIIR